MPQITDWLLCTHKKRIMGNLVIDISVGCKAINYHNQITFLLKSKVKKYSF